MTDLSQEAKAALAALCQEPQYGTPEEMNTLGFSRNIQQYGAEELADGLAQLATAGLAENIRGRWALTAAGEVYRD